MLLMSSSEFTLESEFPDKSIKIVLESIRNSDKYVGVMRPSIDGSNTRNRFREVRTETR